jgi:DNA repair exonuclease SbcCD nuclease subunit
MRFIHAADLHIDSPLRGLDRYQGAPVEKLRTATRAALENLVDLAIKETVDCVLLAGDIYDSDWQDFHTGLYFREQMVRLGRADIPVFIIHGNHDAQGVISRQVPQPDNVTVFSSRTAETVTLDSVAVAIHGRSFPNRAVNDDLVPGYPDPLPGYFNIGLLHTSLTGHQGHDTYAPTDLATLSAKGYDYWALGHVHTRQQVSTQPHVVFPGNLQGRHANEIGAKGCELVTVTAGRIDSEFIPLDVVRWHHLVLPVDKIEHLNALPRVFQEALTPYAQAAPDRLYALRVTLTGRSELYALEARQPGTLAAAIQAAAQDIDDLEVWIEQVRLELSTPLDRQQAAQRDDAVGELLRLVDALAAEPHTLQRWAGEELGKLLDKVPPEVSAADAPKFDAIDDLRALLHDAEATVLARLAVDGDSSS